MELLDLLSLQRAMKETVLGGNVSTALLTSVVDCDAIAPENRLQIHRNNYRQSLIGALGGIFPATKAFVGDAFIEGALGEFVLEQPPETAALSDYGGAFPDFFGNHKASSRFPYIVDLLRLEWALHCLQAIDEATLEGNEGEGLEINPNARVIESEYPLMSLWSVATGQLPPEAVHIEQGGQTVVALLTGGEVRLLSLSDDETECLNSVQDGHLPLHDEKHLSNLIKKHIVFKRY